MTDLVELVPRRIRHVLSLLPRHLACSPDGTGMLGSGDLEEACVLPSSRWTTKGEYEHGNGYEKQN
jgi:hypothetical protein